MAKPKKITIEAWIRTGSGESGCRHYFEVEVTVEFWESMSKWGRAEFIKERAWEYFKGDFVDPKGGA